MGSRQVFAKGLALTALLTSWPDDRVVADALITHPIVPGQAGRAMAIDFQGMMTGVMGALDRVPEDSLSLSGVSPPSDDAVGPPSTGAVATPAVPAGTVRVGTPEVGITARDSTSSVLFGGSAGTDAIASRVASTPQPVLGDPSGVGKPIGQFHDSARSGGPVAVPSERLSAGKDIGRATAVNPAGQVLGDPANVAGSAGSTGVSSSASGTSGRAAGGLSAAGNASDASPTGPPSNSPSNTGGTTNSPSNTGGATAQAPSGAASPAGAGTATPSAGNPSPASSAPGTNSPAQSASNPNTGNTNSPGPSASNPNTTNSAPGSNSPAPSVVASSPAANATLATPPAPSSATGAVGVIGGASPQLVSDAGSSNGANTFNQLLNVAVLNQVLGGLPGAGTGATPASPASASPGLAVSGSGLTGDSIAIGGLPSTLATDSGKTILPGSVFPPASNFPLPAIQAGDQVRQASGLGTPNVAAGGSVLPAAIPEPSPLYLTVVAMAVYAIRGAVCRIRHAGKGADAAQSS